MHDPVGRGIETDRLTKCFHHVVELPLVSVSRPPSFQRFKEQYIKLHLWEQLRYERLLYMDADFNIVRFDKLMGALRSDIDFGGVQDWNRGAWASHWNGGFILLKPDTEMARKLFDNVDPFIAGNRFDTEMSEQGYISAYFDKMGFTLPTTYNLNLAIMYQNEGAWKEYVKDAVAIHFTWVKPWLTEDMQYPFDLWHANLERAKRMMDDLPMEVEGSEMESDSAKFSAAEEEKQSAAAMMEEKRRRLRR